MKTQHLRELNFLLLNYDETWRYYYIIKNSPIYPFFLISSQSLFYVSFSANYLLSYITIIQPTITLSTKTSTETLTSSSYDETLPSQPMLIIIIIILRRSKVGFHLISTIISSPYIYLSQKQQKSLMIWFIDRSKNKSSDRRKNVKNYHSYTNTCQSANLFI